MSKNDVTGDSIISKVSSKEYRDNYDLIFGSEKHIVNKNYAYWSISLDTECPKCQYEFDLLDGVDFLFDPIENGTKRTEDYECVCPKCRHEFVVDFQY